MLELEFFNYSLHDDFIWSYVEFLVSPEVDLEELREACVSVAKQCPSLAPYEEPRFWAMELKSDSVRCWLAGWADDPGSAWSLKHEMNSGLGKLFQERGITPHRVYASLDAPLK